MNEVTVTDAALREAASKGSDEFLALVIDAICASVNNELTAETMAQLNADQITLYGFKILHEEVIIVWKLFKKSHEFFITTFACEFLHILLKELSTLVNQL